jgi:hypothetical protein
MSQPSTDLVSTHKVRKKFWGGVFFFPLALQPPWALTSDFFQFLDHFTDGRTPWTSDQLIARALPKHRTTQTQNKYIHIPDIHALCGIRTHDPGFWVSKDSTCLRRFSYRDRRKGGRVFRMFNDEKLDEISIRFNNSLCKPKISHLVFFWKKSSMNVNFIMRC